MSAVCVVVIALVLIVVIAVLATSSSSSGSNSTTTVASTSLSPEQLKKFFHSIEELKLTNKEPVLNAKSCEQEVEIAILVTSAAWTTGKYYDNRVTVRKSWAALARDKFKIPVYFLLGLSKKDEVNEKLKEEAVQFGDLVQFNFIDSKGNLTLKSISALRWVKNYCPRIKIILRTDDDIVVNIGRLAKKFKDNSFKSGFTGGKRRGEVIFTGLRNRHIPLNIYPEFPPFIRGGAYVLTTDAIDKMLAKVDSYGIDILAIFDYFTFTGFLAEKAGVQRYNSKEFCYQDDCGYRYLCVFCECIVHVECKSDKELNDFFTAWQSYECDKCQATNSSRTTH